MPRRRTQPASNASSTPRSSAACIWPHRPSRRHSCRPLMGTEKSMQPSIVLRAHCARPWRKGALPAALAAALVAAAACSSRSRRPMEGRPRPARDTTPPLRVGDTLQPDTVESVPAPNEPRFERGRRVVRIALASGVQRVAISATGDWRLYDSGGASTLLHANGGDVWTVETDGGQLHAVRADGAPTPDRRAPFVARPVTRGAFVTVNGKPYRGEVSVVPTGGGLT